MTANLHKVYLADGREVCLSYGVIIAAFIPRGLDIVLPDGTEYCGPRGYVRSDARYSVTSSRHASQFAGKDAPTVPDAVLRALVAPITDGRP